MMSQQCVPNWDLEDDPSQPFFLNHYNTVAADDYEVAELTWKDGSLAMRGLRHSPRVGKPTALYPSPVASAAGGTLECIVHQARRPPAVDAVVPSDDGQVNRKNCANQGSSTTAILAPTVPSSSPAAAGDKEDGGGSPETDDGRPCGIRSSGVDQNDSVRRSLRSEQDASREIGTTSISTKRSRVAAVHNQSERKRRDRINQKMKTLQKLLPNSSKVDKASMLDEVIEYLKLLQAQIHMMKRISTISPMILPVTWQQQQQQHQLQVSMMARMSHMSMGLGMVDPSLLGGQGSMGLAPPPMLHPSFLPLQPTAVAAAAAARAYNAPIIDWMHQLGSSVVPDVFTTSMGCPTQHQQQQQMSAEVYTRMAALYQQMNGCNQKI